jgi:hypothetical protein
MANASSNALVNLASSKPDQELDPALIGLVRTWGGVIDLDWSRTEVVEAVGGDAGMGSAAWATMVREQPTRARPDPPLRSDVAHRRSVRFVQLCDPSGQHEL